MNHYNKSLICFDKKMALSFIIDKLFILIEITLNNFDLKYRRIYKPLNHSFQPVIFFTGNCFSLEIKFVETPILKHQYFRCSLNIVN